MEALEVLDIFRKKTAPAFEVALRLGAAYGEAGEDVHRVLGRYSEALGIAYQIRDDLEDLDVIAATPSLPLGIAYERAKSDSKAVLEQIWTHGSGADASGAATRELMTSLGAEDRCRRLLEAYKEQAVRSLVELENASLKGLLRRVVGKIFGVEIKGWCSEFEARNVASGEARAEAAR